MKNRELQNIPYLGVGVGLRREIASQLYQSSDKIDVLEIISENYFSPEALEALRKFTPIFPIIPHGVRLSIGSTLPIPRSFLQKLSVVINEVNAPYYSDHFTIAHSGSTLDTDHLSPIWFTRESLDLVVERVDQVQQYLGLPLVLENITSSFVIPNGDYEEPEFISEVCRRTGCGLLLDLTNVHINAHNRGFNPFEYLERLPMDSVVQIHLAGGEVHDNHFFDSHSKELAGPNEGVWNLLFWCLTHSEPKAFIIERDSNFNAPVSDLFHADLSRIRIMLNETNHLPRTLSPKAQTET